MKHEDWQWRNYSSDDDHSSQQYDNRQVLRPHEYLENRWTKKSGSWGWAWIYHLPLTIPHVHDKYWLRTSSRFLIRPIRLSIHGYCGGLALASSQTPTQSFAHPLPSGGLFCSRSIVEPAGTNSVQHGASPDLLLQRPPLQLLHYQNLATDTQYSYQLALVKLWIPCCLPADGKALFEMSCWTT